MAIRAQTNVRLAQTFQPSEVWEDIIFEVLLEGKDLRSLRSSIIEVAEASSSTDRRGVLILEQPKISKERLLAEWSRLSQVFKEEVFQRLTLVIRTPDGVQEIPKALTRQEHEKIDQILHGEKKTAQPIKPRSNAFYHILRTLLIYWFRKKGPITSKSLAEMAGCTYPTVSAALKRLGPYLSRHSNRSIELATFPQKHWLELLALSANQRPAHRYKDDSGNPRRPEALTERLRKYSSSDVAVGGVLAARHYLPGLDLTGTPRLDITIRAFSNLDDHAIAHQLDRALSEASDEEPAQLVATYNWQPEVFFTTDAKGNSWSDEVDCLLDLHDAKLEAQANELLTFFTKRVKQ